MDNGRENTGVMNQALSQKIGEALNSEFTSAAYMLF
jgi:hypothetical protein